MGSDELSVRKDSVMGARKQNFDAHNHACYHRVGETFGMRLLNCPGG